MNRTEDLESAILDALVESFVLNRASLSDEVVFEWDRPGEPPSAAEVEASVADLLERGWLEEMEVVRLTDEGKAEWKRRNPLRERLHTAWFAQGDFVYAPSEEIADRVTRELVEEFGLRQYDPSTKTVEPWTYELDGSGDVIHGVRVEYRREPSLRRALRDVVGAAANVIRLRLWSMRASRRRR